MKKPFTWSWSALECFEQCPRKYIHKYVLGEKEPPSPALEKGRAIHETLEAYMKNTGGISFDLCKFVQPVWLAAHNPMKEHYIEHKMALTRDLKPCKYFGSDVWGRAASDVLIFHEYKALDVDWKTGKVRDKKDQLLTRALFIFQEFSHITEVNAFNAYVEHGKIGKIFRFTRDEFFSKELVDVLARIAKMEKCYNEEIDKPMPSGLCRYCFVKSCEYIK